MGVVANICPENVIFCSVKAIADRILCPFGYVQAQLAAFNHLDA